MRQTSIQLNNLPICFPGKRKKEVEKYILQIMVQLYRIYFSKEGSKNKEYE